MKVCPQCKAECGNEDLYCSKCKRSLKNVAVVSDKKKKKAKGGKQIKTSVGCFVILIAALVVIILAIFIPRLFTGDTKTSFGEGLRDLIPTGRSVIERIDPRVF